MRLFAGVEVRAARPSAFRLRCDSGLGLRIKVLRYFGFSDGEENHQARRWVPTTLNPKIGMSSDVPAALP